MKHQFVEAEDTPFYYSKECRVCGQEYHASIAQEECPGNKGWAEALGVLITLGMLVAVIYVTYMR